MRLILGSTSPRRKEILGTFSVQFDQVSSDFDEESVPFDGDPRKFAIHVATGKAKALEKKYPHLPILTADTIVYRDGKLFQKPKTLDEAETMLTELSSGEQEVYTGVADKRRDCFVCKNSPAVR
jgi:septum formation protein